MSNILRETDAEISSFSGSTITGFEVGKPVYEKFFDTGSQKWERWSGSGAPYIRPIPSLEDSATNAVRVNVVAGDIEIGTLDLTGSIGLSITGSMGLSVTGSSVTKDIGKSITGSIGLSITGSSTLPISLEGTAISGSVGITGSANVQGSVGITGSAALPVTLIGTAVSGSVGITGSATIPTSLVGTAISGSVGITGSATLPVSLIGTAISGSVGITGSSLLNIQMQITGSSMALGITGSVDASGTAVSVYKLFAPASITGGLTGSVWTPASGKAIRLKKYSLSTDTYTLLSLMLGSGSTIAFIDGPFYMSASGSIVGNLTGINITGSMDYKLFVSSSATANVAASAWGDEI